MKTVWCVEMYNEDEYGSLILERIFTTEKKAHKWAEKNHYQNSVEKTSDGFYRLDYYEVRQMPVD